MAYPWLTMQFAMLLSGSTRHWSHKFTQVPAPWSSTRSVSLIRRCQCQQTDSHWVNRRKIILNPASAGPVYIQNPNFAITMFIALCRHTYQNAVYKTGFLQNVHGYQYFYLFKPDDVIQIGQRDLALISNALSIKFGPQITTVQVSDIDGYRCYNDLFSHVIN